MMFMPRNPVDDLLGLSIAELDIPDALYARIIRRYEEVSGWLAMHGAVGEIYVQGSIRLGTMITPVNAGDDYDVDSVCRQDYDKQQISKITLKASVGSALRSFVASGPEGRPILREGRRCWTLDYPGEPFHMDVLPAIPDLDFEARDDQILLTDRGMHQWQKSNPKRYADWFHALMADEAIELREAAMAKMDVENPPPSTTKTTLQRTVQALKRHRDVRFGDSAHPPASIVITTLAARAYRGGGDLYEVLNDITLSMPDGVERRDGVFWVPNPVLDEENFAHSWEDEPARAEAFFDWIEQARADFAGFGAESGLDRVIGRLQESFGVDPVAKAAARRAAAVKDQREQGRLGVGAMGALGVAGARAVPDHTFHGDAPSARRP